MFDDIVRFWFDRGADGLRIDVAHGLFKAAGLPDLDAPATVEPMRLRANPLACNQIEVHEVYRRWRRIADGYEQPRVLVGEANLPPADVASYTRPDELHQVFAFAFLAAPWDARAWLDAAVELLDVSAGTGASTTWVVENHDVTRAPTRYGGGARGHGRARAAILAVLGLPGAAYLYQGQELGPARGGRARGPASGPGLGAQRRLPRRMPRPDAVDGGNRWDTMASRPRRRRAVAARAGRVGAAVRRGAERRRRLNAGAVPLRAGRSGRSCTANGEVSADDVVRWERTDDGRLVAAREGGSRWCWPWATRRCPCRTATSWSPARR